MAVERAPYFWQLCPYIGTSEKDIFRKTRSGLLEVHFPFSVTVTWIEKDVIKTCIWQVAPGQVLRPVRRAATGDEIELFQEKPEKDWPKGVIKTKDGFKVQIVQKLEDLPSVCRQVLRHIPASVSGKEITIRGQTTKVLGSLQETENQLKQISRLQQQLSTSRKITPQLTQAVLSQIAQTEEALSQRQLRDQKIRAAILDIAFKVLRTLRKIQQGMEAGYNRLGKLIGQLQTLVLSGENIPPKTLLRIGNEAGGIYAYLCRVATFNPYYQRVHSPEVKRLSRASEHAQAGKAKTVLNDLESALNKIEAVVIGERPLKGEITLKRQRL